MSITTFTSNGVRWRTSGLSLADNECLPVHSGCSIQAYRADGRARCYTVAEHVVLPPKKFRGHAVVVRTEPVEEKED